MDFSYPPEVEAFRQEVREFVLANWPDGLGKIAARHGEGMYEEERAFRRKVGEKGWLALSWPKAYGGQERSPWESYAFHEELSYLGARAAVTATTMVAPTLIHFGTEEQKRRLLPVIARGDADFCLGYSEPDAGSDLAALKIRAVDDGDAFVVNGIKRWTSLAHRAEYCWLAARTDPDAPKHRGISLFIVDLKSPGLTIRPLHTMGERTNETYWEDVRIPRANLVGEINRGWYYLAAALDFERLSAFRVGKFRRSFEQLVAEVRRTSRNRRLLKDDPLVRQKVAQIAMELEATQVLSLRAQWIVARGEVPNYEASMLKVYGTEAQQRMAEAATQIFGLYSQIREACEDAVLDGEIEREYRFMVLPTFAGGASELQRGIIATRGMGLPRG